MRDASLIGLDWGTTSCRAYLIGSDGTVIDQKATADGILSVEDGNFDPVFDRLLQPWLSTKDQLPILASGMITSRNGWLETPYLGVPAGAADFAKSLCAHVTKSGHKIHFVTGVTHEDASGTPDVLRGEETEILGHMSHSPENGSQPALYVVPGTHSKWVGTANGALGSFQTFMTGEVYAALRTHTILSRLTAEGPFSQTGFDAGAKAGLESGAALLHRLFAVRTLPLFEKLTPVEASDYLSGLLIGAEVAGGLAAHRAAATITIIGQDDLAARYERALKLAGVQTHRATQAMVATGHWTIAKMAGLIR